MEDEDYYRAFQNACFSFFMDSLRRDELDFSLSEDATLSGSQSASIGVMMKWFNEMSEPTVQKDADQVALNVLEEDTSAIVIHVIGKDLFESAQKHSSTYRRMTEIQNDERRRAHAAASLERKKGVLKLMHAKESERESNQSCSTTEAPHQKLQEFLGLVTSDRGLLSLCISLYNLVSKQIEQDHTIQFEIALETFSERQSTARTIICEFLLLVSKFDRESEDVLEVGGRVKFSLLSGLSDASLNRIKNGLLRCVGENKKTKTITIIDSSEKIMRPNRDGSLDVWRVYLRNMISWFIPFL